MKRLLIVEDEELARKELETTIPWENWGFMLIGAAEDGQEALEIIKTHHPDIIISDIRMPGMDGLELLHKIKELNEQEQPLFVFLSGHAEFSYAQEAVKNGAFDFLIKPIDDEELESTMKKAYEEICKLEQINGLKLAVKEDQAIELLRDLSPNKVKDTGDPYVEAAIKDISEHFIMDLSSTVCAAKLGISGDHLSRLIKKATGLTFNEYLTRFRMKHAMELLRDPTVRIGEIADLSGYQDARYFSTKFRRTTGMSPSEFRHGKKNDQENE